MSRGRSAHLPAALRGGPWGAMTDASLDIGEAQHAPGASASPARRPLTRERILHVGLRLIDEQGLEAFSMRRLAQELGVDPMSLYHHFRNKDALLDGVAAVLWEEVTLSESEVGWIELLRSSALSLRALAHTHPRAF